MSEEEEEVEKELTLEERIEAVEKGAAGVGIVQQIIDRLRGMSSEIEKLNLKLENIELKQQLAKSDGTE
jgi:hypothetical protein